MATLTTDWFKANYNTSAIGFHTNGTSRTVGAAFYTRTPTLGTDQAASFASVTSLASLDSRPEWVKVRGTATATATLSLKSVIASTYSDIQLQLQASAVSANVDDGAGWKFGPTSPDTYCQDIVTVVVLYLVGTFNTVVNPVILATDQGMGSSTVVHDGALFGQLKASGSEYLVKIERYYDGSNVLQRSNPVAGYCLLLPAEPKWQSAHAHHLWLEPQRTNFAVNPSFKSYTTVSSVNYPTHWRSNATLTEDSGAGKVTATTGTVIESCFFPSVSEWLSISFLLKVSASMTFKFGVVLFDDTHTKPTYLVADTRTMGAADTFTKVQGLLKIPSGVSQMCYRLQVTAGSGTLWLDDVLLDPHESQYEYFDGSTTKGLTGDFRWMGGSSYADKHYSVWYNNFVNTKNRLVGDYDVTDDRYKAGLVEDWAPQGANIIAHWDAITSYTPINWVGDAFYPISNVAGSTVTNVS